MNNAAALVSFQSMEKDRNLPATVYISDGLNHCLGRKRHAHALLRDLKADSSSGQLGRGIRLCARTQLHSHPSARIFQGSQDAKSPPVAVGPTGKPLEKPLAS